MGRWSWSSDFWDFDHDGYSDLYVANGYLSAVDKEDIASFFWRQVVAQSPEDTTPSAAYEHGWNAMNELIRSDNSWNALRAQCNVRQQPRRHVFRGLRSRRLGLSGGQSLVCACGPRSRRAPRGHSSKSKRPSTSPAAQFHAGPWRLDCVSAAWPQEQPRRDRNCRSPWRPAPSAKRSICRQDPAFWLSTPKSCFLASAKQTRVDRHRPLAKRPCPKVRGFAG